MGYNYAVIPHFLPFYSVFADCTSADFYKKWKIVHFAYGISVKNMLKYM